MNASKLIEYLDSLTDLYGIPMGDLCVRRNHEEIFRYRFGCADSDGLIPLTENHYFRLFSCTKIVTMIAVLQQMELDRMHFEDHLSDFLPEYEKVQPITIANLMSMTAGFSYDVEDPNVRAYVLANGGEASTREAIRVLSNTPLLYEPGTRWLYSLAHDVLAAVVEVTSGEKFGAYLRKHIFEPLEITDLIMYQPEMGDLNGRLCVTYGHYEDGIALSPDEESNSFIFGRGYESGGAGLCGTVSAYSAIVDALACGGIGKSGKQILKSETIDLLKIPVTVTKQLHDDFAEFGKVGYEYGYGVRVRCEEGYSSPVGEFGWDGAAGAYALVDTSNELSITYAEHLRYFEVNYAVIHPQIRDLVYKYLL